MNLKYLRRVDPAARANALAEVADLSQRLRALKYKRNASRERDPLIRARIAATTRAVLAGATREDLKHALGTIGTEDDPRAYCNRWGIPLPLGC